MAIRAEARAKIVALVGSSKDPLEFVCNLACDPAQDVELRLSAASIALPYLHPRLSAMATVTSKAPEGANAQAVLETVLGRIARLAPTVTIDAENKPETDAQSDASGKERETVQRIARHAVSSCPQGVSK